MKAHRDDGARASGPNPLSSHREQVWREHVPVNTKMGGNLADNRRVRESNRKGAEGGDGGGGGGGGITVIPRPPLGFCA